MTIASDANDPRAGNRNMPVFFLFSDLIEMTMALNYMFKFQFAYPKFILINEQPLSSCS